MGIQRSCWTFGDLSKLYFLQITTFTSPLKFNPVNIVAGKSSTSLFEGLSTARGVIFVLCNGSVVIPAAPVTGQVPAPSLPLPDPNAPLVVTWGTNVYGQLGLGFTSRLEEPKILQSSEFGNGVLQHFSASRYSVLVVNESNTPITWGSALDLNPHLGKWIHQGRSQIGRASPIVNEFRPAARPQVLAVGADFNDNWAICDDNNIYLAFSLESVSMPVVVRYPTEVNHTKIIDFQCGDRFCVFVDGSGKLFMFGTSAFVLGTNSSTAISVPPHANAIVTRISVGPSHIVAVTNVGRVYGWGDGSDGSLENGMASVPVPTLLSSITLVISNSTLLSVASGSMFTLYLVAKPEGKYIHARGAAGAHQLVSNSNDLFASIVTRNDAIALYAAPFTSYLLTSTGAVYAWGKNEEPSMSFRGMLGVNYFVRSVVEYPSVSVLLPPTQGRPITRLIASPNSFAVYAITTSDGSTLPVQNQACTTPSPAGPEWICIDGVWVHQGDFTVGTNGITTIIITGPTNINRSLTVPPGTTITFTGSGALAVIGCVTIQGQVSIELTPEEIEQLINNPDSRIRALIESKSGCIDGNGPISVSQPSKKCIKIRANRETSGNTLNALFTVDSSSCNRWWIILVSVLGGVILITAVAALVWYTKFNAHKRVE